MAYTAYPTTSEGCERDKLASLKCQLERHIQDVKRLEAAIKFLEENPGAQALMNSI